MPLIAAALALAWLATTTLACCLCRAAAIGDERMAAALDRATRAPGAGIPDETQDERRARCTTGRI